MRIVCPNCTAAYEVATSRVTQHRLVRCARCRTAWAPVPSQGYAVAAAPAEGQPAPVEAEALPSVTAMDRLAAPPPGRGGFPALLVAWVLSLAVLGSGVVATVVWRDAVMRAWPASALVLAPFAHKAPQSASNAAARTE